MLTSAPGVGFAGDPKAQGGVQTPSTQWPIQRFGWSDCFTGEKRREIHFRFGESGTTG